MRIWTLLFGDWGLRALMAVRIWGFLELLVRFQERSTMFWFFSVLLLAHILAWASEASVYWGGGGWGDHIGSMRLLWRYANVWDVAMVFFSCCIYASLWILQSTKVFFGPAHCSLSAAAIRESQQDYRAIELLFRRVLQGMTGLAYQNGDLVTESQT